MTEGRRQVTEGKGRWQTESKGRFSRLFVLSTLQLGLLAETSKAVFVIRQM